MIILLEIAFQNDEVLGGPIEATSKPEPEASEIVFTDESDSPSIVTEAPLTCSSICSKEINQFKNNYTELAMAYFALHEEIQHLHKHIEHHDQILKHIALMSHRFHKKNHTQDELIKKATETDQQQLVTQQTPSDDLTTGKKVQNENEHILTRDEVIKIAETKLVVEDDKKSYDEDTKSYVPKSSLNIHHEIIQHQHNNLGKFFPHLHRTVHHHHIPLDHSVFEKRSNHKSAFQQQSHEQIQKRLQTMDKEMKTYFTSNDKLQGMEDSLMDDNIYATCEIRANRHITLLNQQDISGRIHLWQRKPNGPLQMHVKLKGFKVASWNKDFPQHTREVRETIIVPIETVPDKPQDDTSLKNSLSHMHGIHIHEFGNLTRDCQSTGSHYNPYGTTHGGPFDAVRHVGDLGNVRCDDNGEVDVELTFSHVSLTGEHSIVGRSIVVC